MKRCEYCKKVSSEKGITFHRFPGSESQLKIWTENMGKPDWVPSKNAVLCSEHFTSDCFERWWKLTRLRKGRVPTIFLPKNHADTPKTHTYVVKNVEKLEECSKPVIEMEIDRNVHENEACEQISPKIQAPIYSASTPKASTCRKQVALTTSRRKYLVRHDHHYEDSPRMTKKKLKLLRQKYELSQNQIKVLKLQVDDLKTTVDALRKVVSSLSKKKRATESASRTQYLGRLQKC